MVILALGYQLHFSINSAPFYLRFAKPGDLQWLMPVFWIGFNIAMFPASVVTRRRGGLIVMGAAGLLGALAILGAELAGNLNTLIATQFIAGAAWGCMLMSAISAALAIGDSGAEGKVVGLVFSALALGPSRGWRRSRAACKNFPNTRRCCTGRRWRVGRSRVRACWLLRRRGPSRAYEECVQSR